MNRRDLFMLVRDICYGTVAGEIAMKAIGCEAPKPVVIHDETRYRDRHFDMVILDDVVSEGVSKVSQEQMLAWMPSPSVYRNS